ncbi:MAG: DEAD/DEAH box helicase [Sulfurimonas sp. RIFCSPLOWO2_12_FULL_36_74]|uniref:DEAD/DEAH box helicase n=1 Tax=Sulfurimonas sp. RIFCSPLOWO2_12_36_12 TaxID=1802253 RepID=UPI0008C69048|nr:DEAD/DEAH box helicase [Sulfurimonas sp. RIFCSPLOWO2_12_36_12]OHD99927.1 MAG: DEAD/DEAH box helicase [Sulfurimonas sp. RIFCSPLOWO2_02_FULL_36_28]OHE02291.1 MAG: DEAD/DEAH box helicase [Sulfurimonas sp. RIFCSPLOWO2_12_36_12]OHE07848.1 MAG: DEAD/DEAH box helicase [Sulfurimonas sp. RIFCSPLOWO2_12_FULL_36_74]
MQENAQTQTEEKVITFDDLGLKKEILKSVKEAGFTVPSPIQAAAIPFILAGRDIVGQAHTGTGKTAAFGLPALNNINPNDGVGILVITPTRELATQVSDELFKYGRNIGARTVTVYGGSSYNRQIDLIERGASVVVATPGRLLDILKKNLLKNFAPSIVVLDEADEMLDMGFLDDINEIFSYLPSNRQTLLFSATMPKPIKLLAERILDNPEFISITKGETTNTDINQEYYVIEESERDDAIIRLMDSEGCDKSIVFCRTKSEVDRLSNVLSNAGYLANGLHGDMEQRQRETVIKGFKNNGVKVLVATDVAARGIHVDNISHVFNYHIPFDPESYVHRIGRTGRAGTKGKAITLLTPLEFKELQRIKTKVGTTMTHAFVPSKNDLRATNLKTIVTTIENQKIYDEAHQILDMLKEDIDEATIMFKLVSMILDKQTIAGPNSIGIPADKLAAILDRASKRGDNRSGGRGGYKGTRSRSGGGGDRNRSGSGDRNRTSSDKPRSSEGGSRPSGGGYRGANASGGAAGGERSRPSGDRNRSRTRD